MYACAVHACMCVCMVVRVGYGVACASQSYLLDVICACVAWRGVAWRGVAWRGVVRFGARFGFVKRPVSPKAPCTT